MRYDSDKVGPRQLIQVVADAGYQAHPVSDEHVDGSALREKEKKVRRRQAGRPASCPAAA